MEQTLTTSTQDYLKHIYEMTESGENATTSSLAEILNVKPASVTAMLQRLASVTPALVEYHKHQGAKLTGEGKRAALEVIRHHRLLETWLVQSLGYSWDEVHEEAEMLEHVISEDFEKRIAAALGNPLRDPHGELIPTADLKMPPEESTPLSALRPDQVGTILSVKADDMELLRYLDVRGLVPGARLTVTDYSPFDDNLTVKILEESLVLGLNITEKIFVRISNEYS
jgi:DtxR family Mn-dependent transcriptional regulator